MQVNNTFGENHDYVLTKEKQVLPKEFHVSPFFPLLVKYRFDFSQKDKAIINYYENDKLNIATYIEGDEVEYSSFLY